MSTINNLKNVVVGLARNIHLLEFVAEDPTTEFFSNNCRIRTSLLVLAILVSMILLSLIICLLKFICNEENEEKRGLGKAINKNLKNETLKSILRIVSENGLQQDNVFIKVELKSTKDTLNSDEAKVVFEWTGSKVSQKLECSPVQSISIETLVENLDIDLAYPQVNEKESTASTAVTIASYEVDKDRDFGLLGSIHQRKDRRGKATFSPKKTSAGIEFKDGFCLFGKENFRI